MENTETGLAPCVATTIHPPPEHPSIALAYSDAMALQIPEPARHRRAVAPVVAFAAAAVALAAAVAAWVWIPPQITGTPIPEAPPTATPAAATDTVLPQAAPTFVDVPDAQRLMDSDDRFINELASHGLLVSDRPNVIKAGHVVCSYLIKGVDAKSIETEAMQSNTTLTADDAHNFLAAAVHNYCPQVAAPEN